MKSHAANEWFTEWKQIKYECRIRLDHDNKIKTALFPFYFKNRLLLICTDHTAGFYLVLFMLPWLYKLQHEAEAVPAHQCLTSDLSVNASKPPPTSSSPASVAQTWTSSEKPWWVTATSTETERSRRTSWLSASASSSANGPSQHHSSSSSSFKRLFSFSF